MKTGIVVGAAPIGSEIALLDKYIMSDCDKYIIAADGGIEYFLSKNICPDHFIGDMDSNNRESEVRTKFPHLRINSCSPIKDVTDMEIGIEDALENKCDDIVIFGGSGGKRLSHMFANIQLMSHYKNRGINITMYGDDSKTYIIKGKESKIFKINELKENNIFISVLALTDIAKNVRIKNMFYEYEGDLTNCYALGVSNELKGMDATITLDDGLLLIIEEKK